MKTDFIFRDATWDRAIFNCINKDNEYRLPDKFDSKDIIIDIGAHIGSFSYACITRGCGKVLAYEASPDNYELAYKNLQPYNKKVKVYHKAVWRSDKDTETLRFKPSAEEYNTGGGTVWSEGMIEVPVVKLDDIIRTIPGRIRLLKLDCEGSEFPILFTSRLLHKAQTICGEFHEIGTQRYPRAIPSVMRVDGFAKYSAESLQRFLEHRGFKCTFTRSKNEKDEENNLGFFFAEKKQ